MRTLLVLAILAFARGLPVPGLVWDEWPEVLDFGGGPRRVCIVQTQDGGFSEVCCEGYTGRVIDGCPTPICSSPCLNGGTCTEPNHCKCTNAYTGDTCSELKKEYVWTTWHLVMDNTQQLYQIKDLVGKCKNTVPEAMECQTLSGVNHTLRGQVMMCDRRRGFECLDENQPENNPCDNYQVRLLCPADDSKKGAQTCIHKQTEYNVGESVKDGDCIKCDCVFDGRWKCHYDRHFCDIPMSTTPAPVFDWHPVGVRRGDCMVGETVFSPGETTKLDCKMCTCFSATGWQCVDSDDTTCRAPRERDYCQIKNHFIFFHGQTTKKDCNTCICKNREWDCTETICPDKNRPADFSQCVHPETNVRHEDGKIVERDCNICVCTQGKWECTRYDCGQHDSLAEGKVCTTPTGLPYHHGATISMDCNACKCFDGMWKCTRRFCSPETYPDSTCLDVATGSLVRSGKTIHRGCDVCLCNGGKLTCTSKACHENTGVCFDEQRRFTTSSTAFDKQYLPVCNENGFFHHTQCNHLHSVCFCVTSLGHVIPHTAVKIDVATPNCQPYMGSHHNPLHYTGSMPETPSSSYPCIERTNDTTSRLTGYHTPQCLPNGYFASMQCDPHTGICYCVNPMGTTIPGSIMHVSQGRPNCLALGFEEVTTSNSNQQTPCQQEKRKAEQYKLPFKPTCDRLGKYVPLQTNPLTKVKFCVDQNGMVMEETINRATEVMCRDFANYRRQEVMPHTSRVHAHPLMWHTFPVKDLIHITPWCDLQQRVSEHVPTVYRPWCETDGRYQTKQCSVSHNVCFCLDVTGTAIPKTAKHSDRYLDCSTYRSVLDVVTPSNTSTIMFHPSNSPHHASWDHRLSEIEHDAHLVGPQSISTDEPVIFKTEVTACIRQQQIASVVPGVFRPTCQRNGAFNTMQHEPLSQEVYCVDTNGVKIEGTVRRMDYQSLPECDKYWNTTLDMQQTSTHWSSESPSTLETFPIPLDKFFPAGLHHNPSCTRQQELTSRLEGAVVPTCEADGTYTPLQCNATTGVCYCMLPYGDVLPDTVMPIVKGTPNCWHLKEVSIMDVTHPVDKVCMQPVVVGPCRAHLKRWAFSKILKTCTEFFYGGCRGNLNRFKTKEECETACISFSPPRDTRPLTCERELARFTRLDFIKRISMRRPSCSPDGNYNTKQCTLIRTEEDRIEEVCDCVDKVTGKRLETCPEEEMVTPSVESVRHSVDRVAPSQDTIIDGCLSEDVLYHRGDSFFKECNECTCLGNGQESCTLHTCHQGLCYHLGVSKEHYERGCEICTCVGGQWGCTRKDHCDPDESHTRDIGDATECTKHDGSLMHVGSHYYDDCNKCTCDRDGHVHCQNKYCPPRHCYHLGKSYHERDTTMQDCNHCTCFSGHWQCQNFTCDPYDKTRIRLHGCEYKGVSYKKGQTFHDKCNPCKCLGNNHTACLKDPCNPSSCFWEGMEIRSGHTKRVDCNTCTCYNGQMDCTQHTCSVSTNVPQVNLDTSITCMFEGKDYTNGQQFWKDCNPCRCSSDGAVWCEEESCVPNLCYMQGYGYPSGKVLFTETHKCTCYNGGVWHCEDKMEETGPPDYIECSSFRPMISCLVNPCDNTICPRQPDAVCKVDNCGHCLPVFFDDYGNRLRC